MQSTSGSKVKLIVAVVTVCLIGKAAKVAKHKKATPAPAPPPSTPAPVGTPAPGGNGGGVSPDPARTHTG